MFIAQKNCTALISVDGAPAIEIGQDEVAFAEAIDRILNNPEWANQLGETGQ